MEPMLGRAFSTLSLSAEQLRKLHKLESSLPDGRYCLPFEILRLFQVQNKTLKPEQEIAMAQCHSEWLQSHDNDNRESGLLYQEKIHLWDKFVRENFDEPLPKLNNGGWNS